MGYLRVILICTVLFYSCLSSSLVSAADRRNRAFQNYEGPAWWFAKKNCQANWMEKEGLGENPGHPSIAKCIDLKNFSDFFKKTMSLSSTDIDILIQQGALINLIEDYHQTISAKLPYFEGIEGRIHHLAFRSQEEPYFSLKELNKLGLRDRKLFYDTALVIEKITPLYIAHRGNNFGKTEFDRLLDEALKTTPLLSFAHAEIKNLLSKKFDLFYKNLGRAGTEHGLNPTLTDGASTPPPKAWDFQAKDILGLIEQAAINAKKYVQDEAHDARETIKSITEGHVTYEDRKKYTEKLVIEADGQNGYRRKSHVDTLFGISKSGNQALSNVLGQGACLLEKEYEEHQKQERINNFIVDAAKTAALFTPLEPLVAAYSLYEGYKGMSSNPCGEMRRQFAAENATEFDEALRSSEANLTDPPSRAQMQAIALDECARKAQLDRVMATANLAIGGAGLASSAKLTTSLLEKVGLQETAQLAGVTAKWGGRALGAWGLLESGGTTYDVCSDPKHSQWDCAEAVGHTGLAAIGTVGTEVRGHFREKRLVKTQEPLAQSNVPSRQPTAVAENNIPLQQRFEQGIQKLSEKYPRLARRLGQIQQNLTTEQEIVIEEAHHYGTPREDGSYDQPTLDKKREILAKKFLDKRDQDAILAGRVAGKTLPNRSLASTTLPLRVLPPQRVPGGTLHELTDGTQILINSNRVFIIRQNSSLLEVRAGASIQASSGAIISFQKKGVKISNSNGKVAVIAIDPFNGFTPGNLIPEERVKFATPLSREQQIQQSVSVEDHDIYNTFSAKPQNEAATLLDPVLQQKIKHEAVTLRDPVLQHQSETTTLLDPALQQKIKPELDPIPKEGRLFVRVQGSRATGLYYENAVQAAQYFDGWYRNTGKVTGQTLKEATNKMHEISAVGNDPDRESPYKVARKAPDGTPLLKPDGVQQTQYRTNKINPGKPREAGYMVSNRKEALVYAENIARDLKLGFIPPAGAIEIRGIPPEAHPFNYGASHQYPDARYLDLYYERGAQLLNQIRELPKSPETRGMALDLIAQYYHLMVNARPYEQINNSLFMNQVNRLLRGIGHPGISHGSLDHLAQRLQLGQFLPVFWAHVEGRLPDPSQYGITIP